MMIARTTLIASLLMVGCGEGNAMFNTAKWASGRGNSSGENVRLGMTAGLAKAEVIVGASRNKVHSVLGKPDHTSGTRETYDLGRSDYAPDYESLVIDYDADGRVRMIVQHQS